MIQESGDRRQETGVRNPQSPVHPGSQISNLKSQIPRLALFPGCSLEGSAHGFLASLTRVLQALEVPCETLRDWSCCGATSAHALDHDLYLALNLRNLALAQDQGYDAILAPCAACYHRLAGAAFELGNDPELRKRINAETKLDYRGGVAVRNVLDFLAQDVGAARIRARVIRPLSGLNCVCYYGCLNTRIPRMPIADDREYPMNMDRIAEALGASPLDWSYKTECCGASLFVFAESVSAGLVARILEDAAARGADCIAVACPMCHNNLDTKQDAIREQHHIARPMPIVFVTQLMGLAFGMKASDLGLNDHFVPFEMKDEGGKMKAER